MTQRKIAILGGGMAGLTAAYQLTKTAELREQNSVTVYQLGWRLGGKAASGRDTGWSEIEQEHPLRSLEHGLHVWFGCYENTFQLIQELYAARTPPPGGKIRTWQDAVKPQDYTPVGVLNPDGAWSFWPLRWPRNSGVPGDGALLPTWGEIIETALGWLEEYFGGQDLRATVDTPHPGSLISSARQFLRAFGSHVVGLSEADFRVLLDLVGRARDAHARTVPAGAGASVNDRMILEILEVFRATLDGIWNDLIWPNRSLECIDEMDFRDWLKLHGADPQVVDNSTIIRVLYDTLFQYQDGDVAQPSYAAGTGLGVIMRLVGTYKGSMMYDIQAGMGEVIVAPLYEHLLQAGVRFRFFRKVTSIEAEGTLVQIIRLDRQADVIDGKDYTPTATMDGLTYWPAEPFWEQLVDGDSLRRDGVNFESYWCPRKVDQETLTRGADFDTVILAISLGAYKPLNDVDKSMCAGLMRVSQRFDDFVRNVGVVPTQSVQLWCNRATKDLGWSTGKAATVSGPEYLNIWADMTQVIAFECWPAPPPLSLHYLTGTYKTTLFREPSRNAGVPAQAKAEIRAQAIDWLNTRSAAMWPGADAEGIFDWNVLAAPADVVGDKRFDAQFWRANIDPTECCTLSAAGTTKYRLHPQESGFDNLVLAGEGTRHGFNTTAIEGAVMSGAAASRAICGQPTRIVGYDFLQRRPSDGPGD
jgi:uncharacterized protein with NAD-binding domain and iron-sulfur cluster